MSSVGDALDARGASAGARIVAATGSNQLMGKNKKSKESFGAPAIFQPLKNRTKLATSRFQRPCGRTPACLSCFETSKWCLFDIAHKRGGQKSPSCPPRSGANRGQRRRWKRATLPALTSPPRPLLFIFPHLEILSLFFSYSLPTN